jgi:hypothetical protein
MSIESAVVLDDIYNVITWHLPEARGAGHIADSRELWETIWKNRGVLGAIVHSHPGGGTPMPSSTDVTTFSAVELAIGQRIRWGIMSKEQLCWFEWKGPEKHDYKLTGLEALADIDGWRQELHEFSYGTQGESHGKH